VHNTTFFVEGETADTFYYVDTITVTHDSGDVVLIVPPSNPFHLKFGITPGDTQTTIAIWANGLFEDAIAGFWLQSSLDSSDRNFFRVQCNFTESPDNDPSLETGKLGGVILELPSGRKFHFGVTNHVRASGYSGLEISGTWLAPGGDWNSKLTTHPWSEDWIRSAEYEITDDGSVTAGAGNNIGSNSTNVSFYTNVETFLQAELDKHTLSHLAFAQTFTWSKQLFYPTPNSRYGIVVDDFRAWVAGAQLNGTVSLEFTCRVRNAAIDDLGNIIAFTPFGRQFVKLHVDYTPAGTWDDPTGQGFETYF
jgi:hypothetical protein